MIRAAIPLLPDGDEAREWAERELADPVYDAAQPTPLDRAARAIAEFIGDLLSPRGDIEWSPVLAVAAVLLVAGLLVTAFLIWGRPRLAHRTESSALLFGEAESRSAAQLRAAAEESARSGDWDGAIVARFRALARSLEERGILEAPPGTTAQGLAARAGRPFPDRAHELQAAARSFDDVRYLRRRGTAEVYSAVVAVDEAIARSVPAHAPEVVPA
ncbi:DUF4129 domain-containing protein [Microbacterium album]|uniref:Protein-glutamine gamma-glutamyltransferase-like C-terminal domain-containing protein n=1 Tax=Microbacterium album TaxID=2053191 RepID=A0A917MKQ6_9MICO|nr:DUF4129 domain-containing protein [Microbacterium album]GGH37675.1 hypothetical protein GCM10010921_07760 [Microbacterium album]